VYLKERSTKQEQACGRRKVSLVSEFVYKKDRKREKKIVTSKPKVRGFSYRPIDDDIDGAIDPCR
jgi:hypothetical protein